MSTTATAVQQTPVTIPPTIKMNSSFHPQGPPQPQQQAAPYQLQPGQQQQSFPAGTPPGPFPNAPPFQQFPQQHLNPQQQQQFAQWAYQQMMFQQQQLAFQPHGPNPQSFMTPQQQQALQMQFMQQQQQLMMQQQQQQQHAAAQQQQQQFPRPPQPPYARENNSSKTSLHSNNGDGSRRRTTSNKSAPGRSRTGSTGTSQASVNGKGTSPAPPPTHRHRVPSTSSHRSASSSTAPPTRTGSNMSSAASTQSSVSSTPTAQASNASGTSKSQRQPVKPSPLSQGSHTGDTKPSYRDVASAAVKPPANGPKDPAPTQEMLKSGGLTGRLRRALSFSALDEAGHEDSKNGSRRKAVNAKLASEGQIPRSTPAQQPRPSTDSTMTLGQNNQPSSSSVPSPVAYVPTEGSIRSNDTATAPKKSRSLFNAKFNRSTDNMSLSSTVSSASMMIRKLGSVGKLVRRNSLMGISSVFKGKKDKERADSDGEAPPEGGDKKKSKFKNPLKSRKAEASVSHATAELEAGSRDMGSDDLTGLSPAAKLVRQHTLRTRAADEARAKAEQERRSEDTTHSRTPTWDKNTATRGGNVTRKSVNEIGDWNGDDDDFSEDGSTFDGHRHQPPAQDWRDPADFEDSDEEQGYGDGYDEEDETVRLEGQYDTDPADEPWAVGIRRSVERTRVPTKGILKNADSYSQSQYLEGPPQAPGTRARSNSNDSAPPMGAEPGPLARIPSPDPDHIDGLHRSNSGSDRHSHHSRKLSTSSNNSAGGSVFLPALNFGDEGDSSSLASSLSAFGAAGGKERPLSGHSGNFPYSNADFNASAPALAATASTTANPKQPAMALRSATVPLTRSSKKLTFAANLSVYHTFSPAAYDRRSEPATCNRLTPALAQRIKEELNSYKMEEMEVHQSSRSHTHFFV